MKQGHLCKLGAALWPVGVLVGLMVTTTCGPSVDCGPELRVEAYRVALRSLEDELLAGRSHFLVAECMGTVEACGAGGAQPEVATRGQLWYELLLEEPARLAGELDGLRIRTIEDLSAAQMGQFDTDESFDGYGTVVAEEDLTGWFDEGGWDVVRQRSEKASGVVRFWPGGFDAACNQAVIYMTLQRDLRVARGWILLLDREAEGWSVVERQMVWSA